MSAPVRFGGRVWVESDPSEDAAVTFQPGVNVGDVLPYGITVGLVAQDIEDATEIRLLREALPDGWVLDILWQSGWTVEAWERGRPHNGVNAGAPSPSLAAAARACREAIESRA